MGEERRESEGSATVGDLISISPAPPVVSLGEVEGLRDQLAAADDVRIQLDSLLGGYLLGDQDTRAAFDSITRSLARREDRGDAFLISGVYGAGKSHLLAALALLAGHPGEAWPSFLSSHPGYDRIAAAFPRRRLVVAIPLDEYPAPSHPLERIVLARLEAELARRHDLRVALTEESHLLDLVARYVVPQLGDRLAAFAEQTSGRSWPALRAGDPAKAAEVALAFLDDTGFPLDWRRSRAEAWAALRRALEARGIHGPLILLDELGIFLAGKDRRGLNADASFLQYLAQRPAAERCWLVCVTQRGLEETGDIDRRTLRQLRDRFRPGFTLALADLGRVIRQRLVRRRDPARFAAAIAGLHADLCAGADAPFPADELERSYPLNPLCLEALQRAAETCLSQARSAVRLLQEAATEGAWLSQPASRLITPDVVFDLFRDDIAMSPAGQRHLHACEVVEANAGRIAPGRERQLLIVMKALCLLGIAELRWPAKLLRAGLAGCEDERCWRPADSLEDLLRALYQRGAYVERARRQGEGEDEYYVDVSTDASERLRQRLNELVSDLAPQDSRVARAALDACREEAFPLAGLAEPRSLPVEWWHARRSITAVCRDLAGLAPAEVRNLAGAPESPATRDDGWLFLASPTSPAPAQETSWREATRELRTRFACALLAWLPRELGATELDHLVEHAALSRMLSDPTLARPRDREFRARLRASWEDSEAEVRRMLRRAYYDGRILGPGGEQIVEPERLMALAGDWAGTLAAAFAAPFRTLFPRFPAVAPERRLAGRTHTNQIVDSFIRPGEANLPPASTLEAHLLAYAAPLGLLEGEERHYRLALRRADLVQAAVAAAPPRSGRRELDPAETISYRDFAGRLAKSEWGLAPEQCELLVAALLRTGHLVALDAFLRPLRLDAVAAPLGDNLPYLMRGSALSGETADAALSLCAAALGLTIAAWDLPTQERSWGEMLAWSARLLPGADEHRDALAWAAAAFGHQPEQWAWAEQARARAEALARCADPTATSRDGFAGLIAGAQRLPGGIAETAREVHAWRECERFLREQAADLARLRGLVSDGRVCCPGGSLLAKQREALLGQFASPEGLVSRAEDIEAAAQRWLETYRRHYLAWHASAHAASRCAPLRALHQSPAMEASRRLARAGLRAEPVLALDSEIGRVLALRCLAGDPLPAGAVVCPACNLTLGREPPRPDASELEKRAYQCLSDQRADLRPHQALLRKRLAASPDDRITTAAARLLDGLDDLSPQVLCDLLDEGLIAWLCRHLGRPRAARRHWRQLESRLRGKEMTRRDALRAVSDWLGGDDDEIVEIL